MGNNINKENDGIIAFLLWSQGGDFSEINQDQRDALPALIESWPPFQKRYFSRIGGILLALIDPGSIKIDEAELLRNIVFNKDIHEVPMTWESRQASIEVYLNSLDLNKELEVFYMDFAKCLVDLMNGSNNDGELLQEKLQLIVNKESKS